MRMPTVTLKQVVTKTRVFFQEFCLDQVIAIKQQIFIVGGNSRSPSPPHSQVFTLICQYFPALCKLYDCCRGIIEQALFK